MTPCCVNSRQPRSRRRLDGYGEGPLAIRRFVRDKSERLHSLLAGLEIQKAGHRGLDELVVILVVEGVLHLQPPVESDAGETLLHGDNRPLERDLVESLSGRRPPGSIAASASPAACPR